MLYLFTLHRLYVTRGLLTVSLNNFLIPSSCYFTQQALEESYKNVSHDARDNSVKCHLSSLPYSICCDHINYSPFILSRQSTSTTEFPL